MYMSNFDKQYMNQELMNQQYNLLNNDLNHNLINNDNYSDR